MTGVKRFTKNLSRKFMVRAFFGVLLVYHLLLPYNAASQVNICDISLSDQITLASDSIPLFSPQISVSGDTIHAIWFALDIFQTSSNDGIQYCHSFDGGESFSSVVTIISSDSAFSPGIITCSDEFVYVSYTGFMDGIFGIIFQRSTDAGITWERPEMIIPNTRPRLIGVIEMSVYIHYESQRGGNNGLLRSDDNGATWQVVNSDMLLLDDFQLTSNMFHGVGTITGVHSEVEYYYSPNQGASWYASEIISREDPVTSIQPKIAVNAVGTIYIVWNDTGNVMLRRSNGYDEDDNLLWLPRIVVSADRYAVFLDVGTTGKFVTVVWDNYEFDKRYVQNCHSADEANNFCPKDTLSSGSNSGEPCVAVSGGSIHYVWSESIDMGGAILYRHGTAREIVQPTTHVLMQNYPNPVNNITHITHIEYVLTIPEQVRIVLYNILGQRVTTLVDEYQEAKNYKLSIDANQFPTGVYFYRLMTPHFSETKKLLILR